MSRACAGAACPAGKRFRLTEGALVDYTLEILERPGYLHFIVEGSNSREAVRAYLAEIVRVCMARDCRRLLIEERLAGPRLGTIDVYAIASGGTARAGHFTAIAYVDVFREGELMKFAEDVAVNRAVPLKVFATVADAERWLAKP